MMEVSVFGENLSGTESLYLVGLTWRTQGSGRCTNHGSQSLLLSAPDSSLPGAFCREESQGYNVAGFLFPEVFQKRE